MLEIPATLVMTAVAIELDRFSGSLTRGAAVFCTRLWGTRTRGILALLFFVIVCHGYSS